MATKTRLYRVHSLSTGKLRLIEASTPRGAISFVARHDLTADIPAQHEVFAMAKSGIEIEVANDSVISDETRNALAQQDLVEAFSYE